MVLLKSHSIKDNSVTHWKKTNDNTNIKIGKLQKDHIPLVKDNDMSSKKFVYERFLYLKFRDKLFDEL